MSELPDVEYQNQREMKEELQEFDENCSRAPDTSFDDIARCLKIYREFMKTNYYWYSEDPTAASMDKFIERRKKAEKKMKSPSQK